eukprot:TRINITY_DN80_c0_g4_i1.p1 TRINITY_DN80_c0_g4~~TRINITY_DN80_c0_g4_i1.p1  ORF type:complete len:227 (-),score=30.61 TRINITY_DN80_c0_g4_i1:293-973(-)
MASQDPKLSKHDDHDSDDSDDNKKTGRRKILIEFIEDKSRRHITFSKRKAGIMKKAYELSTLTGTQVLLLVASETGHVYTFATPKLQPLITKPEGKNLIQACLNAPDPAPIAGQGAQSSAGQGSGSGGRLTAYQEPSTAAQDSAAAEGGYYEDDRKRMKPSMPNSGMEYPMPQGYGQVPMGSMYPIGGMNPMTMPGARYMGAPSYSYPTHDPTHGAGKPQGPGGRA